MANSDTLVGHTVARFQIDTFLGEEELGKVYGAEERPSGRRVTLKVLHPHLVDNYEAAGRFQREMVASAHLAEHPNAVAMLDFGQHHGVFHYIVMEAIDALSLADELEHVKTLPPERVVRISHQIASALGAAHQSNIVHRNLRPENVALLQNADGDFVKIRDFGLSRLTEGAEEDGAAATLTSAGTRIGSVETMAPEYIQQGTVDGRADLYALGCLMFWMLTGHPPYQGKGAEMLEKHVTGDVPSAAKEVKTTPPWLDALVVQLMQKEPNARPGSAGEVMYRLEQGANARLELPKLTASGAARRASTAAAEKAAGPPYAKIAVVLGVGILVLTLGGLILTMVFALLAT